MPAIPEKAFFLKKINSTDIVCILLEGIDWGVCFSDGDSALDLRKDLGLQEHVDIIVMPTEGYPHLYLDGDFYRAHVPINRRHT